MRYGVTKQIDFCYGHRLLNYQGKCRHLHGHNGRVEIELSAARLDRRGMVVDFDEIRAILQRWIDDTFDHQMLLHQRDPLLPLLKRQGERVYAMPQNPTAEAIAQRIFEHAARQGFPVTRVTLWETPRSYATYRASRRHR
ncbi:MAG: 6-carboxytetrahydropterin synthase [Candidatus Omnitrophica bacterium]|nr:6-carboxytetrahydropterin synthase [Candidatus Omnitrophota bacterium]